MSETDKLSWQCRLITALTVLLKISARVAKWVRSLDLSAHTSLSPIRRGFAPSFVNYKKWCTRLAAASDKVYQLLAPYIFVYTYFSMHIFLFTNPRPNGSWWDNLQIISTEIFVPLLWQEVPIYLLLKFLFVNEFEFWQYTSHCSCPWETINTHTMHCYCGFLTFKIMVKLVDQYRMIYKINCHYSGQQLILNEECSITSAGHRHLGHPTLQVGRHLGRVLWIGKRCCSL
jgi:hypothetical protein